MRCFNFLKYWVLCIVLLMSAGAYAHPLGRDEACPTPQQSGLTQVELDQFRLAGLCYTLSAAYNNNTAAPAPGRLECAGQGSFMTPNCLCENAYIYSAKNPVLAREFARYGIQIVRNHYGQCLLSEDMIAFIDDTAARSYFYADERSIHGRAGHSYTPKTTPICVNGLSYDEVARKCICPAGTSLANGICVDDRVVCQKTPHICNRCPATSDKAGSSYIGADISAGCCFPGKTWNTSSCVEPPKYCPPNSDKAGSSYIGTNISVGCCFLGRNWNERSCECPGLTGWNGNSCISCPSGASGNYPACQCPRGPYNRTNNTCDPCTNGKTWNGNSCVEPPKCPPEATGVYPTCKCPENFFYNGSICDQCLDGTANYNYDTHQCVVCPPETYYDGSICKACPQGTKLVNKVCTPVKCPPEATGIHPNCQCPDGAPYEVYQNACWKKICPDDHVLITEKCVDISGSCSKIVSCGGGGAPTFNAQTKMCECPSSGGGTTRCKISTRRVY